MSSNFNIEELFKHDYGGVPKFDRMTPGTKLHKILSKSGDEDILSKLEKQFPKKKKQRKRKSKSQKKKKKKSIRRNKTLKKTN